MKKSLSLLLATLLCFSLSLASFASGETIPAENFSVTTEDILLPQEGIQEGKPRSSALPKPYDIEFTQLDNTPVVIKYYILEPGLNTSTFFPETEDIDKITYTRYEVLENKQPPIAKVKTVIVPISLSSETDHKSDVLGKLPPTMDYNEGGFTGTLLLNTDSLVTEIAGTASYRYPTSTTKEITGLDREDLSYIPKSLKGMALIDVSWTSLGEAQRGDVMVPSSYTATAIYGGTGTGSKATGYDSTAYYEGEVSQQIPSQSFYKVIYLKERNPKEFEYGLATVMALVFVILIIFSIANRPIKVKKGENKI